ncbi:MAG: transglutaminase family protein [Phycisphaerales bacterium]
MKADAPKPAFCRPEAYELFVDQLDQIESIDALCRAATAVSMQQLDDVEPDDILEVIDHYATRVRRKARGGSLRGRLAHLHAALFDELGFTGNDVDYYNPINSYLPAVIATRRGIPVTLSLLYVAVARRLELDAFGVNAPGHFFAGVELDGSVMIVDPFNGGRLVNDEEVDEIIIRNTRRPPSEFLWKTRCPNRLWLLRLLRNLHNIFQESGRAHDYAAIMEFTAILMESIGETPEEPPLA